MANAVRERDTRMDRSLMALGRAGSEDTGDRPPPKNPPVLLRLFLVLAGMTLITYFGIVGLFQVWPELHALEQSHKDAGTLHIEYCPNMAVYAAGAGSRFDKIFRNFHYPTFEFINKDTDYTVTLDETRMMNMMGRVGVRFLSLGLVRLHSLQLNMKFVDPVSPEDKEISTWSNTGRQWTLVATGDPVSEHCEKPTLLNVTRFLLQVTSRHGYLSVEPRRDIFHTPKGVFVGSPNDPDSTTFHAPDVWAFFVMITLLAFLTTAYIYSVVDRKMFELYTSAVRVFLSEDIATNSFEFYSVGPLFLADHLDGDLISKKNWITDGAYSSARLLVAIYIPILPFFPMLAFAPNAVVAWIIFVVMCTYTAVAAAYAILYIANVPWKIRAPMNLVFYVLYVPLGAISFFAIVDWLLWMAVFVSYDPVSVSTVIVGVVSTGVFVATAVQLIMEVSNDTDLPLWKPTLLQQESRQMIIQHLVRLTLLTCTAVIVILYGWLLATPEDERTPEKVGSFVWVGVVPVGQYISSVNMKQYSANKRAEGKKKVDSPAP